MAEFTRERFDALRETLRRMIDGGASDGDVDFYLKDNGVSRDDLKTPPDFVPIPAPVVPDAPLRINRAPLQVLGGIGGSLVGGAAGVAGGPAAPATVPAGALMGGTLGAEFGGQFADFVNESVLGNPDPRGAGRRVLDAGANMALDAEISAIVPGAGQQLKRLGAGIINPVRNRVARQGALSNLQDFGEANIPIQGNAGAITGNRAVQGVEASLTRLPTSARAMQLSAQRTSNALADELERIVSGVGTARTKLTAGRQIVRGVDSFAEAVRNKGRVLFDAVPIQKTHPVRMDNTRQFIGEQLEAFTKDPELRGIVASPKLQGILTAVDRNNGILTWEAAKRLRTAIGEQIADPSRIADASTGELKKTFAVLTADMQVAAEAQGGKALRQWNQARDFWNAAMTRLEVIERVTTSPAAEKAFNAALAGAKDGPSLLDALKKSVPKEMFADFKSALLHQLGLARPGAQDAVGEAFSPRTYLTGWNRLAPESKAVLFGKAAPLRRELDRLARITSTFRDLDAVANPSGTAGANLYLQAIQGGFGIAVGFQRGETITERVKNAAIGGGIALGAPVALAKLFQNPNFVRWLAQGVQIAPTNFSGLSAHLGRLSAIKARSPENAEAIDKIVEDMAARIGVAETQL